MTPNYDNVSIIYMSFKKKNKLSVTKDSGTNDNEIVTNEDVRSINNVLDSIDTININRSLMLPALFKIRGQPMSLVDYPQFEPFYSNEYVPDTIFMCGRQLGKSLNLSRVEVLDMISIPELQMLFVAPLQQQTQRYSHLYLREAIQSCPVAKHLQSSELEGKFSDSKIITSIAHQSFANGAGIQLTYAKTSPDRARGIFADMVDFDELQDQLYDNIPVISESLTASKWGTRRFTGTAKTVDNTIQKFWELSCQYEWVMQCASCNHYNMPTEDGKVLDMIQATGVHCVKCSKKLNVREGEWVAAYPDRRNEFRGYHIPQIVVPAIVEDENNWSKVIRKVLRLPVATIMQEVLGISCSTGARLITQADIDRQSTLPTMAELQNRLNRYAVIVSGVDWGGAEHESFTVHTIIGIRPDGKIDVLWARRFSGFDPDEVLTEIARAHRFYGAQILAADYGMGFDRNVILESQFGAAVVQIMLCRQRQLMAYSPTLGRSRWTVDKTTALELVFMAIKYGKIHFPPQSEFKVYTDDLLSPYEEVRETGGFTSRVFVRNPNRPDDFCMALMFATVAGLRLVNSSLLDLIPDKAFDQDVSGAPMQTYIDPDEILTSL